MDDKSDPNKSPDPRDAVLSAFEEFCHQLDFRLEMITGKDPSMFKIFDNDVNLTADLIGQHVHTFMGRKLVEPAVTALNYEYIAEPRRSKKELDNGLEEVYPDFRIIPQGYTQFESSMVIGEIKTIGASKSAVKQVRGYLSKLDQPAYGIATDGLLWQGRVYEGDEISRLDNGQVSIKPLLHRIRQGIVHERASYDLYQLRESDELNRFIEFFDQIPDQDNRDDDCGQSTL